MASFSLILLAAGLTLVVAIAVIVGAVLVGRKEK